MARRNNRYKKMQRTMTAAILFNTLLFVVFMIAAGMGIIWLKVVTAIFTILISILCLGYLYLTKELLKQRSLWMTAASAVILLCVIAALIMNFPSPSPYKETTDAITAVQQFLF